MAKCTIYKHVEKGFIIKYDHTKTTTGFEHKKEWVPVAQCEANCWQDKIKKKEEFISQVKKGKININEFILLDFCERI